MVEESSIRLSSVFLGYDFAKTKLFLRGCPEMTSSLGWGWGFLDYDLIMSYGMGGVVLSKVTSSKVLINNPMVWKKIVYLFLCESSLIFFCPNDDVTYGGWGRAGGGGRQKSPN